MRTDDIVSHPGSGVGSPDFRNGSLRLGKNCLAEHARKEWASRTFLHVPFPHEYGVQSEMDTS